MNKLISIGVVGFATTAFFFGETSAKAVNLITNGSFESPIIAPDGFATVPNPIGGPNGWNGSSGSIDLYYGPNSPIQTCCPSAPFNAYEGLQYAEVNRGGSTDSFSQIFTPTGPGSFGLSFALAGRSQTDSVLVTIKDSLSATLFSQSFSAPDKEWQLKNALFSTSGSGPLTLTFTATSSIGAGQGAFVDAVSIAEVPAPLPLLGAGAAFGFSRRMRRRISKAGA